MYHALEIQQFSCLHYLENLDKIPFKEILCLKKIHLGLPKMTLVGVNYVTLLREPLEKRANMSVELCNVFRSLLDVVYVWE